MPTKKSLYAIQLKDGFVIGPFEGFGECEEILQLRKGSVSHCLSNNQWSEGTAMGVDLNGNKSGFIFCLEPEVEEHYRKSIDSTKWGNLSDEAKSWLREREEIRKTRFIHYQKS